MNGFPTWSLAEIVLVMQIQDNPCYTACHNESSFLIPWPRHNSRRKGMCGNVQFPQGCLDVSYKSWDKSKNPCRCTIHTFLYSVHHHGLESNQPAASCLMVHLVGKCEISTWAWFLAIIFHVIPQRKNPYLLRNHIIPNEATFEDWQPQTTS